MKTRFLVSLLLSTIACGGGESEDSGTEPYRSTPEAFESCRAAEGDEYQYVSPGSESGSASIEGDILSVTVAYSGGCEAHDFVLCWPAEAFSEGVPVGAGLELWHDANGDVCEAAFVETFAFDLTPLAEAYSSAYGSTTGEIGVTIAGSSLLYSF